MEKVCEFCVSLRSVIYCKADAAYLCLSCDAKVHSANPLSNQHPRTLVCECCKSRPTYIRCYDHQIFMCRGCDQSQHDVSSQHRKRVINSYIGCPSVQELVALWGFDMSGFSVSSDRFGFPSSASVSAVEVSSEYAASAFGAETTLGYQHNMAFHGNKQKESTFSVLDQLHDLRKLQLNGECETLSFTRHQEQQTGIISSSADMTLEARETSPWNLESDLHQNLPRSVGLHAADNLQISHPHHDRNLEPYSLSFSQLDQLTSSSADGSSLQGESFWQLKSPVQSGQLWSQNMQDIGVCEELACFDDLNIPDVDLTFRNFEELFRGEQDPTRPLPEDKETTCSYIENDSCSTATEDMRSVSTNISNHPNKQVAPPEIARYSSRNDNFPRPIIRPSRSTLSFSLSRFSAESSGIDYMDTGLSPTVSGQELSPDLETAQTEAKGKITKSHKDKKNVLQNDREQAQYGYRKGRSDIRKRVKARALKTEGYESDAVDVTRSY